VKPVAAALCLLAALPLAAQTGPARPADELPERLDRERANQSGGAKSNWEREREARDFKDADVALPPPPKGRLIEFFVTSASSFKFFIDPQSLWVGEGMVRYTLVARSPTGSETVSYEGMRCGMPGSYRVYAFGNGGAWSRNPNPEWKPIEPKSVQRWHTVLRGNYFCPTRVAINSAEEGLDALRRGGHPDAVNLGFGGSR
jgi:CNP1-like family protein